MSNLTKARKLFNVAALGLLPFAPLAAQAGQGHGFGHTEDASTPPQGLLRLRAATVWSRFDSRFVPGGSRPLGAFLTADSLGSTQLPSLSPIEADIETAAGAPFTLSMGRSRLDATAREEVVPILFEYGITSRLSVSAMLPVVRKRVATQFTLDTAGGFVANVGPNPHRTNPASAGINAQVQTQFDGARIALQQRIDECTANSALPQCASINGRMAEAMVLLLESEQFATAVGSVYGTQGGTGSPFVPMNGSDAHSAIAQRVGAFDARFLDFLGGSSWVTATPVAAGGPAGVRELQGYLVEELGRDSIVLRERVSIGDWEIGAKFRAIDRPATETSRLAMQVALAGTIRFPSGSKQTASDIVSLGTSTGKLALGARAIMDARFARLGVLASADFATALSGADTIGGVEADSRWTGLHVAPRWHLSGPFAVHGAYSLRSADVTGGDQLVGGGFSFLSIDQWTPGARLPIEMRYTHLQAVSGDAGRPRFSRDQIELRLYYPLLRR